MKKHGRILVTYSGNIRLQYFFWSSLLEKNCFLNVMTTDILVLQHLLGWKQYLILGENYGKIMCRIEDKVKIKVGIITVVSK